MDLHPSVVRKQTSDGQESLKIFVVVLTGTDLQEGEKEPAQRRRILYAIPMHAVMNKRPNLESTVVKGDD